ncbi:hypothetical protein QOZ80_5BG0456420 [Eleusine coracana subsp. coracana]|nr:hypothetical protein QOZ80_5BG0456420 [Eleusine coracana subsp. coracana]
MANNSTCRCVLFWIPTSSIVILLCLLLYRPDHRLLHPAVDSAVLTALHLTTNHHHQPSRLRYDLAFNLSFRNSHSYLSIRYLDIGTTALYNGGSTMLGPTEDSFPTPFLQRPKNTTVLHPAFRGTVAVDSMAAAELKRELAAGTVHVKMSLSLMFMYKTWPFDAIFFHYYDCWLWFPPPRDGAPAVFDAGTRCWPVK